MDQIVYLCNLSFNKWKGIDYFTTSKVFFVKPVRILINTILWDFTKAGRETFNRKFYSYRAMYSNMHLYKQVYKVCST